MTDDTALPRLPPLTDGDLAATEVLALRGSKFGWREVLRLVRDLRAAREIIAFTVRTLDKSRGAKSKGLNPLEVISDQARAEKMLRAFLGGPSGEENRG